METMIFFIFQSYFLNVKASVNLLVRGGVSNLHLANLAVQNS